MGSDHLLGRLREIIGKRLSASLTGKMVKRLIAGLAAGMFLMAFLYLGSVNLLQQYFCVSGYFREDEVSRIKEFQEYVRQNALTAKDSGALREWVGQRNLAGFTVSRRKWLMFDISYEGEIYPGSMEIVRKGWKPYYPVVFADGEADVSVYEGADKKYYHLLLGISVAAGFASCLWIFISGMREDVAYIQQLKQEVDVISSGNLNGSITAEGEDELAQLARGLDQMREKLGKKEQIEQELRAAQEKLVLGMSHDLRTPLTGLLAYMEILKKQSQEGCVDGKYIAKAYDKILLMKSMSDQMFEYFFIDSHKEAALEPPEDISGVLGDYLSEMCALLEYSGFSVDAQIPDWKKVSVQVDTDYLGRIVNNLLSNIEKYGDREKKVHVGIFYGTGKVGIEIKNGIASPGKYVKGSGIGLKNVSLMMGQMGGKAAACMEGETFLVRLYFPVCDG